MRRLVCVLGEEGRRDTRQTMAMSPPPAAMSAMGLTVKAEMKEAKAEKVESEAMEREKIVLKEEEEQLR